jgi:hypothetical protein
VHALSVEYRRIDGRPLARCLAHSLTERVHRGKVVIATNKPIATLAAVKKQWLRLERKVWVERASTLGAVKILELTGQLSSMRRVTFSAKLPDDLLLKADVTFATADDLMLAAPECKTMYVTYEFSKEKLHLITSWMPRGGIVTIYE